MATAAMPPPPAVPTPMPALSPYRMSYALYERIIDLGLLGPRDKVVLLDGILVNTMPKGPRHSAAVLRGLVAFQAAVPPGWQVRPEQPVALRGGPDGDSAPEPDLAVVVGSIERYDVRHPIVSEIGLLVEIASDTDALRVDRAGLLRYAHAGISIVWIVNIQDRSIEVYSGPGGPTAAPGYRKSEIFRPGQFVGGEIGNATTGSAALAPIPVEAFFAPN